MSILDWFRSFIPKAHKPTGQMTSISFDASYINHAKSSAQSDWLDSPIGGVSIFYEAGTKEDRFSRLINLPEGGKGLQFALINAAIEEGTAGKFKGRVQLGWEGLNIEKAFYRFKVYLDTGFEVAKYWHEGEALYSLGSLWLGEPWRGDLDAEVIKLTLVKSTAPGKQQLVLATALNKFSGGTPSKGNFNNVWSEIDDREFPVHQWVEIEVGYKKDCFYVGTRYEGETVFHKVIDKKWNLKTLTNLQPLKLYARGTLIDFCTANGYPLGLVFDNFKYWSDWE